MRKQKWIIAAIKSGKNNDMKAELCIWISLSEDLLLA
jgi:hypothetical protein